MPVLRLSAARDLNSGLIAVRTDLNLIPALRFSVVSTPVLRHQSAMAQTNGVVIQWQCGGDPAICRRGASAALH